MPRIHLRTWCTAAAVLLVGGLVAGGRAAADWPTYRGDGHRSGYTAEALPAGLALRWTYKARQAPQPAWSGRDTRTDCDQAFHTVHGKGLVFFGSSANCKVYALEAESGEERWSVFTDGPIRFAPAVWKDRVFVVSDDGFLYCLAATDGEVLWRRRGGPMESMVLGNDRIVSRWPARGGPVVVDDIVYYGAGIFPSEGIYLYALDAETGEALWCNDSSGNIVMEQPHGGNRARSGISAQGHLAADADRIYVPTGRGVPAVLDRLNGDLLYFHLAANAKIGGSEILVTEGMFFNGGYAYDARSGSRDSATRAVAPVTVAFPGGVATWRGGEVKAFRWGTIKAKDAAGNEKERRGLVEVRSAPCVYGGSALAMAGEALVSGGKGPQGYGVSIVDLNAKQEKQSFAVSGDPLGLSVADGRLYVSTAEGVIHCYGPAMDARPRVIVEGQSDPVHVIRSSRHRRAAEEIINTTGVTRGYCLDLGCGDGELACALARRTELDIVAIDKDPKQVALARQKLTAAGLYGTRVTVHLGDPALNAYPDYFANLVVSGRSVREEPEGPAHDTLFRHLRPYGGVAITGPPGAMKQTTRGALEEAGDWTHQYANAASTLCSTDALIRGPLGMLWYTDFGFQMPSRHGRGPSPLAKDGVLVTEGVHGLLAVDAYNGCRLWEYSLPDILLPYDQEHLLGTAGTNSNMCLDGSSIYVRVGDRCLRLDLHTGEKLREYIVPARGDIPSRRWGHIACEDGILYGTRANEDHLVRSREAKADLTDMLSESTDLFALDVASGGLKWLHRAKHSIRHNAIVIGEGRVYLIDSPMRIEDVIKERRGEVAEEYAKDVGPAALVCLDAATGDVVWQTREGIYGTTLALSTRHDVLVMGYQYSQRAFQLPSEKGDRLTGLRTSDGKRLWDAEDVYISRPLINDRTVYTQPFARDLLTGERHEGFSLTGRGRGGCGTISGSEHLLLYRSGPLAYTDLLNNHSTENYGGARPGCWINAIPAGGLVLMPDATDRCTCSYLLKTSLALQPWGIRPPAIFPAGGASGEPITVTLTTDTRDIRAHYTLDGTAPTTDSPRYTRPILVSESVVLKARAFKGGQPPSWVNEASFTVDPSIVSLGGPDWRVYDSADARPPESDWQVVDGVATELSNHFKGIASESDPLVERPGTYRSYTPGKDLADGELSLEVSSADDDGIGVAFRFAGPERHYVWDMNAQRGYHRLACKDGDSFRVLAGNKNGYERNRWYSVRIVLSGAKITVYVDGKKDVEATDDTLGKGTFALYSWGSTGTKFRNVRWEE